ncbi:ribonucleotide-diphosphate reductase subunit alpha [Francisella persica ATCC VR-331]|uniref:Ribonucleoside-diphosphate reductase n=1 Tax=Francisella persica ATCC VR-331 TaxID=1086726 RepID=A0AAC8VDI7_9GAMM|nr:ribonucleoside-diphosphate reductase subunit alpha [Francisella persica]ALB01631.1 ribonucleotide-diphosphate reductase subunit alpha [Francisella persica ATCC VR-331]ANH77931.1 ribonucleotide-diphosphate reductase subunit alpha [Francisella persica ATCC VR-331]
MSNQSYLGINIDLSRDHELSEQAQQLLTNYYCLQNEPSPQYAFARASVAYSFGDMNLAQRVYDAAAKGWFMFASPVLSNAPLPGAKVKSLPISCFLSYVPDSLEGLIEHSSELRWLSVKGGGVGGHWSSVRAVSDKAPGPIPFMHTVDADMVAYRQGKTRKGSYAAYMDVSHPDIIEFLGIRVPTGDVNRKCLNLHHAVNLTDDFMQAVSNDQDWKLIDPDDKTVRDVIKARRIWETILETRYRTGEPYLNFIDTANRALPKAQKNLGLTIKGSNLCNEIHLVTDEKRTAVCCLSSVNLEKYDEWKDTSIIKDLIRFLDNVLQFFIDHAGDEIAKARYSASRERSLGLGAMGFHSYLQLHRVPFESQRAKEINEEIFKHIKEQALEETLILGAEKGEAPDMAGTGRRNAHLLAIAPNANSSLILNTSPSIEPWKANAFTSRTRVGSHLTKNKYLEQELEKIGKNTEEVWSGIITNGGSVQQLDFFCKELKEVFKTAIEMDQVWLVYLGGERQKHLCQGQSLNVFFPAGASREYLHKVHFNAWKYGCKGLYYLRTETSNRAENISKKVEKKRLVEFSELKQSENECIACEG